MARKLTILVVLLLCIGVSSASALVFEITYDRTFTAEEITIWRTSYDEDEIFGVSTGPALFHMSLRLDTGAASVIYYPDGSTITTTVFGDVTAANAFYGYANAAISNLTATFGTKTWELADLQNPIFGIGLAGLWMDAPLIDGGTSHIVLDLEDFDGRCSIGWMWLNPIDDHYGMYQDGRASVLGYDPFSHELFGLGGIVAISAVTPVPEPATMLLLGSGLIGLAGYGRKKFFKK